MSADSLSVLYVAKTMWGEARGEGATGMAAVGCVIRNRVENPRWWGDTWITVCTKPYQFSCWNPGDPNLPKLDAPWAYDEDAWTVASALAKDIVVGVFPDITNGANHYCRRDVNPSWRDNSKRVAIIRNHDFFRL